MKLGGKVVVITGSTRGIGREVAEACAMEGAMVVISSRQASAVEQVCEELKRKGYKVSGIRADVSKQNDLDELLLHAIETWGQVDVWINNAGMSGGYMPLVELSREEIDAVVDVNLKGTLNACRIIIPFFIGIGGGLVINMSGKGGRGDPSPYLTAYSATKAAVTNLSRSLAVEYASYPISIHSVLPGMVETDFFRDIKTSPKLESITEELPYVLNAFGVSIDDVGRFIAGIAAQKPGKTTGKQYTLIKGWRLLRGIVLITWYRATSKLKSRI